jgi:hypothetical protein
MGMSWYSIANEEVNLTIQKVMKENHGDLHAAGVTITALIARSEEGPAIKVRGSEAAGSIRITKLAERTLGLGDALMTLDGERMDAWTSKRLQAVIDHELRHLMLAKNKKTGQIQLDDEGRPKLRIRPHDFEFGWFARTAELYGEESYEVSQAREIVAAQFVQNFLPGFEIAPDPTGLGAFHSKLDPVRAIGSRVKHVNLTVTKKEIAEREKLQSEKTDDNEDSDDFEYQVNLVRDAAYEAHQERKALRQKVASERRKAVHEDVRRQSTAALSAKATKPKRASKKGDTVAS